MKARSRGLRSLLGNHMDQIATMITHIANAGHAGRDHTVVGYSRMKADIAEVLKEEGFIKSYSKKTQGAKSFLSIDLFVQNRIPKIKGVKRHSKPSKRVYKKSSEIRAVKQGYGLLVLSTPKGVMSGRKAKKEGLGGEALFSIW
jgi:small subunit ribosomal protein S8